MRPDLVISRGSVAARPGAPTPDPLHHERHHSTVRERPRIPTPRPPDTPPKLPPQALIPAAWRAARGGLSVSRSAPAGYRFPGRIGRLTDERRTGRNDTIGFFPRRSATFGFSVCWRVRHYERRDPGRGSPRRTPGTAAPYGGDTHAAALPHCRASGVSLPPARRSYECRFRRPANQSRDVMTVSEVDPGRVRSDGGPRRMPGRPGPRRRKLISL